MATKTYLLAPNLTTLPGGQFQLGAVISTPFRPTKPLYLPVEAPEFVEHVEFDRILSRTTKDSLDGSVWAQFLQTAGAGVGMRRSKELTTDYTMDCLVTHYLRTEPTDADAERLARDPKIKATINAGLFGNQPVFMITGLKIAKGFNLTSEASISRGGNANLTLPVTDQVSAGAELDGSRERSKKESLRAGNDIIFAYQLHVIATKGWRNKDTSIDLYVPKAAFLNDDHAKEEWEKFEATSVTAEDLLQLAMEELDSSLDVVEVVDVGERFLCVSQPM